MADGQGKNERRWAHGEIIGDDLRLPGGLPGSEAG